MSPAASPAAPGAEPAPRGDLLLALAVLGVVALLLLPLPPFALDGLLAISIGVSLLVLLVASGSGTRRYLEQQLASHAQDAATALSIPLAQSLGRGAAGFAAPPRPRRLR